MPRVRMRHESPATEWAKGTFIGCAFLYGLGAMGEEGVTAALCGLRDIQDVDAGILAGDRPGTIKRLVSARKPAGGLQQHGVEAFPKLTSRF